MARFLIAIDPGLSGGIAYHHNGSSKAFKMPKQSTDLRDLLKHFLTIGENHICFIEKVGTNPKDLLEPGKIFRLQKMLKNYEQTKAILETMNIQVVEVMSFVWQRRLFGKLKMEKPARKKIFKEYAQENFPSIKVNLANADALCILIYGNQEITSFGYKYEKPEQKLF